MVNQVFETIFNLKENEIKEKTDLDVFPRELALKFQEDDRKILEFQEMITFEESVLTSKGEQTYMTTKFPLLDSSGHVYAICGISTNITERKNHEQKLIQIQAALNNASDAVLITNKEGKAVYINKAFETLFQKSIEEINKKGIESLYVQKDVFTSAFNALARKEAWEGESKMLAKDEKRIDAHHRVTPVLDENANNVGALLVYSDITEQKSVEHQLRHAQKMESIGQLAAGIAHEINTPTQYVMNNTKFIQEAF